MTITFIDDVEVTGGVDTHRDTHMVAALDQRGAQFGVREFMTTLAGYRSMLGWLESFGTIDRVGVEGTVTYGAGLTRFMHRHDVVVIEVACGDRQARRSHGSPIRSTRSPRRELPSLAKRPRCPSPGPGTWKPYGHCEWSASQRPGTAPERSIRCAP